jgi:hypothetical protein
MIGGAELTMMIRCGLRRLSIVMIDSRSVVPRTMESSSTTRVSSGFTTPRVMS